MDFSSTKIKFNRDYLKKRPKPKDKDLYLKRRKQSYINFGKGVIFEKVFKELNGGVKPNYGIGRPPRFIDNRKHNVAKELKSGYIKFNKRIEKQILKDIDILANKLDGIKKTEWHIVEGVDEVVLKFIQTQASKNGVLDKFKIILY